MREEKVVIEDGLIVIPESMSAVQIFDGGKTVNVLIDMIRAEVAGIEPDLTTHKGRAAIASRAAKVSKSKVMLDNLGKELNEERRKLNASVDAVRKSAREELDSLRDEVRKPLTDWEREQDRIALEEQAKLEAERKRKEEEEQLLADHESAIQEDELITLRKKAAAQQAEIDRQQQAERDRIAAENDEKEKVARAEREEKDREQREESIRLEAEAKVKREHEEKLQHERDEQERIDQIKRDEQVVIERKARNKRHQASVNNKAVAGLVKAMSEFHSGNEEEAKEIAVAIVTAIAQGRIPNVDIKY